MDSTPTRTGAQPGAGTLVAERSWDDVMDGHHADTATSTPEAPDARAAHVRWCRAVRVAAAQLAEHPDIQPDPMRLAHAVDLASSGAVTLGQFTKATVLGSRGTYEVNPYCTCPDRTLRRIEWCKHKLAVRLTRMAHGAYIGGTRDMHHGSDDDLATEAEYDANFPPLRDDAPANGAADTPRVVHTIVEQRQSGAVMHEAPYSATAKVVDAHGFGWLLTIRNQDQGAFYGEFKAATAWLAKHGYRPEGAPQSQGTGATTPPANVPGGRDTAPKDGAPTCQTHGAAKVKASKFGGHYCAAKMGDGFCDWKTE